MASPPRALALLPLCLALSACTTKLAPDDPAAAISTGIPVGAKGASGVRFDMASGHTTPVDTSKPQLPAVPLPPGMPPDPFAPEGLPEPHGHAEGPALPTPPKPPKKGTQL